MRRSKRELERGLDELGTTSTTGAQAFLWADMKAYYGAPLTAAEQRLLENPEKHLSEAACRRVDVSGGRP